MDKNLFKDKHVVFITTHCCKTTIIAFMRNFIKIIDQRPDVTVVITDSQSGEEIRSYIKTIRHPRVIIEFLDENLGKARATNNFIAAHINQDNLPATVWSIDPDLLFDQLSFDYLLEAIQNVPDKIGLLGMRYKKNEANPEMNLWFPAKNIVGKNGKTYSIVFPFFCCVAGPILVMKGKTLKDPLNFVYFPQKQVKVYGGDDTDVHDKLVKHGYKNGYLNGTLATHLKSGHILTQEMKDLEKKL